MLKKILAALAAVTALSASAHADWLELTPHAGYSTVAMAGVNHSNAALWGWSGVGHLDNVDSGFVAGLDASSNKLTSLDWLSLGLRGEYLQTNEAINDSSDSFSGNPTYNTDQGSLSSVLIGGKISLPFSEIIHFGLGAWLGWGYATLYQHVTVDPDSPISNGLFSGSGLVGELEGSVDCRLGSHFKLSFVGGWRWADFAELKDGNGTPLYDNFDAWLFETKIPVNVDFSGATAQGSISFLF